MTCKRSWLPAACVLALLASGCVERTLKIRTSPPGAIVVLNDEEVGVTPARVAFTWYGEYDVVLRKSGYETIATSYRANPPWFQWPVIDLICETLVPGTLRDEHELPLYEMKAVEPPPVAELIERAEETRMRAISPPPR